jgi:uncharacterized protein (DUF3820 family)
MTDESLIPFGKYKDEKMANVPASYLIWMYESGKCYGAIKQYIIDNLEVLKEEIKRNQKK